MLKSSGLVGPWYNYSGVAYARLVLNMLFFIYTGPIKPPYAPAQLEKTTTRVRKALEAGEQPIKWLFLHKQDIPLYIKAMRAWQEKVPEILSSRML